MIALLDKLRSSCLVENRGYRASFAIEGNICLISNQNALLSDTSFTSYDHFKITKWGKLIGYWRVEPMEKNKFYRDTLCYVPFSSFIVLAKTEKELVLEIDLKK